MKLIAAVFALPFSLQLQAGFWDTLESLTHKDAWKKPVETTLIVGGAVIAVPVIIDAAGRTGSTNTNHPGSCPCPYSIANDGSVCGNRSAWSRSGGYEPLCYWSDSE